MTVATWLEGGTRNGTVPALRAMFNDAASAKARRMVATNPFARLGIRKTRGNRDKTPPTEEVAWSLIRAARELTSPSFAALLQVACFTGMRLGELDAFAGRRSTLSIDESTCENSSARGAAPSRSQERPGARGDPDPPALAALLALPHESEFCFVSLRGDHWTASSRAYHWKAVKASVGFQGSLYLATRHHAGWYMVNVLGLDSEDVAFALGHEDGGEQVRKTYGHRDRQMALQRVANAYDQPGNVRPLQSVRRESG